MIFQTHSENDARPQGNGFDIGYDESALSNAQLCSLDASNDSPTLVNTPTAFAATATGVGPITYTWEFGDGAFGSGASPVHTYTAPGNYTAIVTATNGVNVLTATTPVSISVGLCFATPDDGGTVFSNVDARVLRRAVGAAAPNSTVKIAGTCAGVATQSGTAQVVLITQTLTLAGGYTTTNWTTAYPITQPTTLDAQGAGRVISASA